MKILMKNLHVSYPLAYDSNLLETYLPIPLAHRASGNVNERTQAIYDSIDPPNELRNRIHHRNLALVHVALIISLMQRVAGSTVTNDRQHGARGGMYGAHENYVQPYPVTNS